MTPSSLSRPSLWGFRTASIREIRPSSMTKLKTVLSLPSRTTRSPSAPLSHTVSTTAVGVRVANFDRNATTLLAPVMGWRAAATSPAPSATTTTSGGQHVDPPVHVASAQCGQEPLDYPLRLRPVDLSPRQARGHVLTGAVRRLADRGGALVERCGDLLIGQVEDIAEHEDRALGRRERRQHGDAHQVGAWVADLRLVGVWPTSARSPAPHPLRRPAEPSIS